MVRLFQNLFTHKPKFPKKRALVLEGGGMRGVFVAGVLQAFADRNYYPWKLITGTSAGALIGTAYAGGQVYLARDAFFTQLLSNNFIRKWNILKPDEHILNLDWMVDTIINGEEPLDIKRVKHACPLLITATHCPPDAPPQTVYLSSRKDDIPTTLKATAAIPFLYRGFIHYNGYDFLDGAVLDPIPYQKALAMGFKEKDILVVTTRQRGYRKGELSFWARKIYETYYKDPSHQFLLAALGNYDEVYNGILDELEQTHADIQVIYPPEDFRVSRLTRDAEKILEGFNQGVAAARQFLMAQ
ncbi:MAG: patatin family protein [Thermodesulfobacteriota bacterium]|nr:patatin family protein [Thermodesulfobacteriota bacterium]